MDIDFACTKCGKCCHDLRLPLTVTEALAWLERGDDVQLLCDASPWLEEPSQDNLRAAHRQRRSFAAMSGSLPARVVVVLVGAYVGPCPNLLPDMRCGIYEQRPLVCRIYPGEINPFIELTPAHKACPPDAWMPGLPPLLRSGQLVGEGMPKLIQQSREIDASEVAIKQHVCQLLGINRAAVWNEGFVAYSPDRVGLLAALRQARAAPVTPASPPSWHFISNRRATVDTLLSVDAFSSRVHENGTEDFEYLGLFPTSE